MATIQINRKHNGPHEALGEFHEAIIVLGATEGRDHQIVITARERCVEVELWYPQRDGDKSRESIRVGMCDVRANGGFEARYDFDRDGWSITQDLERDEGSSMATIAEDQEVAFIEAFNEVDDDDGDDDRVEGQWWARWREADAPWEAVLVRPVDADDSIARRPPERPRLVAVFQGDECVFSVDDLEIEWGPFIGKAPGLDSAVDQG